MVMSGRMYFNGSFNVDACVILDAFMCAYGVVCNVWMSLNEDALIGRKRVESV